MWVTRENVCARCHRKCVTKPRQAHAARRDEVGVPLSPESSLCNLCTRLCMCACRAVRSPLTLSFLVEPLWSCVSLPANRDELVIPSSITPGYSCSRSWRQKFTSTSEAVHDWCSAAKPLTADLITGSNMFYANKIKKLLFYPSINIISLSNRCIFVLFCFTQQFFCSNSGLMAHGYRFVIVSLNH